MKTLLSNVRFVRDYAAANLLAALEYRASFISQIVSMITNDIMWVTFWWIYFTRFQVLQGGWGVEDVLALWAIVAVAFGISVGIFGNSIYLAEIISQGKLDYYLALPKNVLLHALVSRMDIAGLGDLVFGTGLFVFFLRPSPERLIVFLLMSLCAAIVLLAVVIIWQSLAFWLGNAEGLAAQMWNALLMFSTYPEPLFRGFVKALLFTVIPATFLSHIPVELLRRPDPFAILTQFAVAVSLLALAIFVFYRGLRRYESGNLMVART